MFYRIKNKTAFLLLGLLLLFATPAQPDNRKRVSNLVATLVENLDWQQFNQVWVFRPRKPDSAVYLHIYNRNPNNQHTFTVQFYQTPSNTIHDWTNNQGLWQELAVQGNCSPIPANSTRSCFVNAPLGGQLAIRVTGAVTAPGTPDTADIFIVQATPGVFPATVLGESPIPETAVIKDGTASGEADVMDGSLNALLTHRALVVIPKATLFTSAGGTYVPRYSAASSTENLAGSNQGANLVYIRTPANTNIYSMKGTNVPSGISTISPLQLMAWGPLQGTAYSIFRSVVDPTAGLDILNLSKNAAGDGSMLFVDSVIVSSSVAFEFRIETTSAVGVTCSDITSSAVNFHAEKTVTGGSFLATHTCTTDPVKVGIIWQGFIPVNQTITIPLPVKMFSSDASGLTLSAVANVTGTVTFGFHMLVD